MFTSRIKDHFAEAEVTGIDVSATAVATAAQRFSDIIFKTADITADKIDYTQFDCIFMTEVIWYILPSLEKIFGQIHEGLKISKGVLIINNHLYQDAEQKYGREYITTLETLIAKLPFHIEYLMENNRLGNYDVSIICIA